MGKRDHAHNGPQSDSAWIRPPKRPQDWGSGEKSAGSGREDCPQRGRREEERQEYH